jgi:hypothetical protein
LTHHLFWQNTATPYLRIPISYCLIEFYTYVEKSQSSFGVNLGGWGKIPQKSASEVRAAVREAAKPGHMPDLAVLRIVVVGVQLVIVEGPPAK